MEHSDLSLQTSMGSKSTEATAPTFRLRTPSTTIVEGPPSVEGGETVSMSTKVSTDQVRMSRPGVGKKASAMSESSVKSKHTPGAPDSGTSKRLSPQESKIDSLDELDEETMSDEAADLAKKGLLIQSSSQEFAIKIHLVITRMKKLIMLVGLHADMYTAEHDKTMETFITTQTKTQLLIYFDPSGALTVALTSPTVKVEEMYYFLKNPGVELVTINNFNKALHFGNMKANFLVALLNRMNTIYAPIILNNKSWPESIKNEFSGQLYSFMASLSDVRYKLKGQTHLYVPPEVESVSLSDAAKKKEFVQRLEGVLQQWTRQLKELAAAEGVIDIGDSNGPLEEIDYWYCRCEDLLGVVKQLVMSSHTHFLAIMRLAKSSHIPTFEKFAEQIKVSSSEAESNYKFLLILKEPCTELRESIPDAIPPKLPKLINLIRIIWVNSPYYNTRPRITGIFQKVSNEIMKQCCKAISLDRLIEGHSVECSKTLQESIKCCTEWKNTYERLSRIHHKYSGEIGWYLETTSIFAHTDAFVQRCTDLLQICDCQIHFARKYQGKPNPLPPLFAGRTAPQMKQNLLEIEQSFERAMDLIIEVKDHILDVRASLWHETYSKFHLAMKDLDIMVQNLINLAFEPVLSISEAISVLDAFYHFRHRETLKRVLDKKIVFIFNMLSDKINAVRKEFAKKNWPSHPQMPNYAGKAFYAMCLKNHIEEPMQDIIDSWWIPRFGIGREVINQYNVLVAGLNEYVHKMYQEWLSTVDSHPARLLEVPLLCRSFEQPNLIESNFDRSIWKMCQEVLFWKRLQFQIPHAISDVYDTKEMLRIINENLLRMIRDYNRLLMMLSPDEQLLFKERIGQLDRKVLPGLTRITWANGPAADLFISEVRPAAAKMQNLGDSYKQGNTAIGVSCQAISDLLLINIDSRNIYEDEEYEAEQKEHRALQREKVLELHSEICKQVENVFDIFKQDGAEVRKQWWKYCDKMDEMVEEALKLSIRKSLKFLLHALAGEGKTPPMRLFRMKVVLENNDVDFRPSINSLYRLVSSTYDVLCMLFKGLPRIAILLSTGSERDLVENVLAVDKECKHYQTSINNAMNYLTMKLQNYMEIWDPYKDIWQVNKDMFIHRYREMKPTVATFDADIARYTEVANNVQTQETLTHIKFAVIDCSPLKQSILTHCLDWQNKFTNLLKNLTESKLQQVYNYMEVNTKKMKHYPETLEELKSSVALHHMLSQEKLEIETGFDPLHDQFVILSKYEVPVADMTAEMLSGLSVEWETFLECLRDADEMLKRYKEKFKIQLQAQADELKRQVSKLVDEFRKSGPVYSNIGCTLALSQIQEMLGRVTELKQKEEEIRRGLQYFKIDQPPSRDLQSLEKEQMDLKLIWELAEEWEGMWLDIKNVPFQELNVTAVEDAAGDLLSRIKRISWEVEDKQWEVAASTEAQVSVFRSTLPIVVDLKNPSMRDRHWEQVKNTVGQMFDETSTEFDLQQMMMMSFDRFSDVIYDISVAATKELAIEEQLAQIKIVWEKVLLDMAPYKDKVGQYYLRSSDEVLQILEDNQLSLTTMKASRYVKPFESQVDHWERALSLVLETVESIMSVQRLWMYLENIFVGEDIRKQLPAESRRFDLINDQWKMLTVKLFKDKNALRTTRIHGMVEMLVTMTLDMEEIQKSLDMYLETKRRVFPRFYFISNDDLLEILGQSKNPEAVQQHLKKCFDNLVRVKLVRGYYKMEAHGMYSAEGEYVEFQKPLVLDGPVESWLSDIEFTMRATLHELLNQCKQALKKNLNKRDKWMKDWPGQLCITANQMQWTNDCTRAIGQAKEIQDKRPLKVLRKKQIIMLNKFTEAIRSDLPKLQRLKIVALVTIEVHARDVIERLIKTNTQDVNSFEWLAQLRFYWENNDCMTRQTSTQFAYRYEYLGNSGRLVITPLTDRCYITLTTALHLHRGGSPKGPAGTGKTETVKDLGKALATYVIVINCSEGLDYISMGKMFCGLAQSGAWVCYDEFNRINVEVLSVVAQQVISILSALTNGLTRFVFIGNEISLEWSCGIFITMNPGYAGRTELPDNLKSMFRPMSMVVPDSTMISEIILFGEGFENTRVLAKKVTTLYALCMQQLSKQDHYDFGLRGLVSVLRHAGRKRRENPHLPNEEVLLLAMKDMNVPKLTAGDLPLFNGIINDLFPGIEVSQIDYSRMIKAIKAELDANKYQSTQNTILKVIQLFETKQSRHSSMVVGDTQSGKSITWHVLKKVLTRLNAEQEPGFQLVRDYPLNPKAISLAELYGEFNLLTSEWVDGILSNIARTTCSDDRPDEKWIVFDGPVDTLWIESMNSLMDDNKVLTLINGERISMPEQVSLLFETQDLSVASPATVSRCGMVYQDYRNLGWRPYVDSWLLGRKKPFADELRKHFDLSMQKLLDFKRYNCDELVALNELSGVISLCELLDSLVSEKNGVLPDDDSFQLLVRIIFVFCIVWSVCAAVTKDSRFKIDSYIREAENTIPNKDTVYEYYVDTKLKQWIPWDDRLPRDWKYNPSLPFFKLIVPTIDTVRYNFLVSLFLKRKKPALLVGQVGTGKTSVAQSVINELDQNRFRVLIINMSAQTTSNNVQQIIESKTEKRTKGMFYPIGGKTMVTLMDDLNMPAKDVFGSQPPLELIRMWLDYDFWYDRGKQVPKYIKEMILLAAMGPPGGGRTEISPRFQSRFALLNMPFPQDSQIKRIYGTMITQKLVEFDDEVKSLADDLSQATIDMYSAVAQRFLPTPKKIHYLFNLRDISKVFQGLLRTNKNYHDSVSAMLRLWIHECFRVFADRLVDDTDKENFESIIASTLAGVFNHTYHNLCPNKISPIFVDFMNPMNVYEDIRDIATLKAFIEGKLNEYNSEPGRVPMPLVPFQDAIEHLSRILRVIRQPRGNMLLIGIGGSGRQSLSKLSAFICHYLKFQIEIKRNYSKVEFREDLKSLYSLTGIDNKPTVFLFSDTQVVDESFMEDINNVLSSGEVPNLHRSDELEQLKQELTRPAKYAGINPDDSEAMTTFLIDRVRANLHVVLCMSPVGEGFRDRIRMYPAFVNCTTIDWFCEWPQDALLEVADKLLLGINVGPDEKRFSIAQIFATMHRSVADFSQTMLEEMKRHNYVTPTNYLDLVDGYKRLLAQKRAELGAAVNKLRMGLFKMEDTRAAVEVMSVELEVAKGQVTVFQKECDDYLIVIVQQKRDADEQARSVAAKSEKIGEEEVKCKRMADMALADLNVVMPALEEAVQALEALNKKDLTEIKSYGRPPPLVERVMEAVMILRGSDTSWAEAKRQLGDPNFINQLKQYDKDNIPDKVLKKIGTICQDAEFHPEIIGKVSGAARSLCLWVRAMEEYGRAFRIVLPKKIRLNAAEAELREKQRILADAKSKLEELQAKINLLTQQYDEKLATKERLREKAETLVLKLERAEKLVKGLSGQKERWETTVKKLEEKLTYVVGDCLMAAGCVSYLGPFLSNYRESMIDLWNSAIRNLNIACDPEFKLATFLVLPTVVREWNYQGLPNDEFSTENGIIVTTGNRWPLMVDPQGQAQKWIKNMEGKRNLKMIDLQQPDFLHIVEWAIREGWPVLLQNIKEELDPSLEPVLSKSLMSKDGELLIKLGEKDIPYNTDFRFYITTKLSNPNYSPEIASQTLIVNFAVKEQGLESQLLGIVVRKERPELESMKDTLVLNIASGKDRLQALEDEILRLLNETKGSLLDDEVLVNTLESSKVISVNITEQVENALATEVKIDEAREMYRSSAQRASILFFVLNDMSRIDPMYQFSLDSYIDVFVVSIDKSQKSTTLDERILNINDYHTYAVYKYTCRGLFERHKLLFSFHMCSKILEAAGKLNMDEFNFFLRGGVVLDRAGQVDNPCATWLTETAWDNITELDKLSNFHGALQSFEQYPREWNQWYISAEPENTPLPGDWQSTCNELQRMIFIRCLRPDRVSVCVTSFVINNLGSRFVEPPMLDIAAVLDDSSAKTPLVFVLSSGVDPTASLIQLAESRQMTHHFQLLSLGQGQAPAATRLIENGVKDGSWVFLANCHLSMSWMPQLEKMVENLGVQEPNQMFRLWLSSSPHPEFPIFILQAGLKMTTEPPKGIKPNMARMYSLLTESQFEMCKKQEKYKNLLFSLVYFHSLLLERRKFGQLGWNVIYSFNDSDFEVSESLLSMYLDDYEEMPWDALKYLIAGVMYGGHVTDDWDRRLLLTYIAQFFCDDAINVQYYKLSALQTYYIPSVGPIQSYKDFIKTLPNIDSPEAFGQHSNADISSQIIETENLFSTMLSLQIQVTVSKGESREVKVLHLSSDVLTKMPRNIDYEQTARILAPDPSPFNVVLLQEISRYNFLLNMIKRSLIDLERGIQGLVVMSSDLEEVFLCIYDGKVPSTWLRAYPSMKPLGAWTRDLVLRIEQFSTWATTARPPILFWLAGFTFPTGFLTAVLQSAARLNNIPIDTLTWEFSVSAMEEAHLIEPPKEGVYVRSLFLEGGGWDKKNMCLIDAAPMQLICPMPVIHFKPVENKKKSTKGLYICPCYYFPNRSGTADRASFIVAVDLKSGAFPAEHWTKRGTALLLSLVY